MTYTFYGATFLTDDPQPRKPLDHEVVNFMATHPHPKKRDVARLLCSDGVRRSYAFVGFIDPANEPLWHAEYLKRQEHDALSAKRVGRNVAKARERLGWTQEDLASECGMCLATVSRIERGSSDPTALTIVKLAKALDVEPSYLLSLGGDEEPSQYRLALKRLKEEKLITPKKSQEESGWPLFMVVAGNDENPKESIVPKEVFDAVEKA